MRENLDKVLSRIGEEYREDIERNSTLYIEVDIGKEAEKLGFADLKEKYRAVNAVVPLKQGTPGMKVRVDGRTYVNYAQFDSGVAVPGYVAKEARLPARHYKANESMILLFT